MDSAPNKVTVKTILRHSKMYVNTVKSSETSKSNKKYAISQYKKLQTYANNKIKNI